MKKEKGWVLGYDIVSLPTNMTITEVLNASRETNIVYWDSSKGGREPQKIHLGGDENEMIKDLVIIDKA